VWKRSYGVAIKAPPDERGGNRQAPPTTTAPHPHSTKSGHSPIGFEGVRREAHNANFQTGKKWGQVHISEPRTGM